MAAALDAILPAGAVAVERGSLDGVGSVVPVPSLFPGEEELIAGASERRRREFADARACAREALAQLDVAAGPILAADDGAPVWPEGVVGSITHKGGYRAAVVARRGDLAGVGIDAEPDEPLPAGLLGTIASAAEIGRLEELSADRPGVAWDRLLFSAKEAAVKAARPEAARGAGVREFEVFLQPDLRSFTARLASMYAPRMCGRWTRRDGLQVIVARVA